MGNVGAPVMDLRSLYTLQLAERGFRADPVQAAVVDRLNDLRQASHWRTRGQLITRAPLVRCPRWQDPRPSPFAASISGEASGAVRHG